MYPSVYAPIATEQPRNATFSPGLLLMAAVMVSIPLENSTVLAQIGSIARLLGILAAGVTLIDALLRWFRPPHPMHAVLGLFVIWCAFTCIWSVYPALSIERFKTNVQLLLLVWVIWQVVNTLKDLRYLLGGYVAGCCCAAVLTFVNARELIAVDRIRYSGAGADPNEMGLMLAISLPVSYYLARTAVGFRSRVLWMLAMPVALAGIILTVSRGAFISTLAGLLMISFWHATSTLRLRFLPIIAGTLLLAVGLAMAPHADLQRISTINDEIASGRIGKRARLWKAGMVLVEDHPFTGVGAGTFAYATEPLIGRELAAHNTYISVLTEDGIPGFLVFISALAGCFVIAFRFPQHERFLWFTALGIWCIGVSGLTFEYKKTTWVVTGTLIATAGVREIARSRHTGQATMAHSAAGRF